MIDLYPYFLDGKLPINLGEQIHINHIDCLSGIDTRRRLYIKRVIGGHIAYCHHCSDKGFIRLEHDDGDGFKDTELLRQWTDKPIDSTLKNEVFRDRTIAEIEKEYQPYRINKASSEWFSKYDMHITEPTGGLWCNKVGDPVFWIYNAEGKKCGVQTRNISGGPKYTTEYSSDVEGSGSWYFNKSGYYYLFIVEDILSALKVHKVKKGSDVLALLRTTLSKYDEEFIISKQYKTIYVWLDDDEAGQKSAEKLIKRLQVILPKSIIRNVKLKQPKECTEKELLEQAEL